MLKYDEVEYVIEGVLNISTKGKNNSYCCDVVFIPKDTEIEFSSPSRARFYMLHILRIGRIYNEDRLKSSLWEERGMLITEDDVRNYDENNGLKRIFVPRHALITPAARISP